MNRATTIAAAGAIVALGLAFALTRRPAPPHVEEALVPVEEDVNLQTNTHPLEIFRRAFWRNPTPDDRILHAERREWVNDADGVRHWEWFLEIVPGAALSTWLRDENPFQLSSTVQFPAVQRFAPSPSWFPSPATDLADSDIRHAPDGGMSLVFHGPTGHLYASGSGHGFAVAQKR